MIKIIKQVLLALLNKKPVEKENNISKDKEFLARLERGEKPKDTDFYPYVTEV